MSKESVSKAHMAAVQAKYGEVIRPDKGLHHVYMTGTTRKGNIGQAIKAELKERGNKVIYELNGTVTPAPSGRVITHPEFGKFDTLVICHGVNHMDWFEDQPADKIDEQFNVNLTWTARLIHQYVNESLSNPYRKSIVILGSMAHRNVLNGSSIYCAAKAGLAMLARCLAWELAPKGFDVYCVHPSNVLDAPMSEDTIQGLMRYRGLSREEAEGYWGAVCPSIDGFLTKDEIARLVCDLVDGRFPYLAGSNIELPGGQR